MLAQPLIRGRPGVVALLFTWAGSALLLLLSTGCSSVGVPAGLKPVAGFDADRYLGTWHEIARLDHRFERGLEQVTADYSLRPDGSIQVVNRGYEPEKAQWQEAKGVARFLGERTVGSLKVSFFRPFYGGYHVIALDKTASPMTYASVGRPTAPGQMSLAELAPIIDRLYEGT